MSNVALVYRGPAAPGDCADAVGNALSEDFDVVYVGPEEDTSPEEGLQRDDVAVWVQPGGGDDMREGWAAVKGHSKALKQWVQGGGKYVGVCMGGYLAHEEYYGLLLGADTEDYVKLPGADVATMDDYLMRLPWRGAPHEVYFQGGPAFTVSPTAKAVDVVATYNNGYIAAMILGCGDGSVGVMGPHPEAPQKWYDECEFEATEKTSLFRQFVKDTIKHST